MKIRVMTLDDIAEVLTVERQCFSTPWSEQAFRQELIANDRAHYLVLTVDGDKVVAYAGYWQILDEAHITNVAVAKQYRRSGYGRALVEALLADAASLALHKVTLEVRRGNKAAINLYQSFGFTAQGIRANYYYDTGEDAIVMWRGKEKNENISN